MCIGFTFIFIKIPLVDAQRYSLPAELVKEPAVALAHRDT